MSQQMKRQSWTRKALKENTMGSIGTHAPTRQMNDSAVKAYTSIPEGKREVGVAQFRRNLRRGMPPDDACKRRSNQRWQGGYIYRITHRASGRRYIGATTTPGQLHRLAGHMNDARRGRGSAGSVEEAIRQAGFDASAFRVEVLCRPKLANDNSAMRFVAIDEVRMEVASND